MGRGGHHGEGRAPWGGEGTMGRGGHHGEGRAPWGGEGTMGRGGHHGEGRAPWGGEGTMGRGGEGTMGRGGHHGEERAPWGGEGTMGRGGHHGEGRGGHHGEGRGGHHGEGRAPWGGEGTMGRGGHHGEGRTHGGLTTSCRVFGGSGPFTIISWIRNKVHVIDLTHVRTTHLSIPLHHWFFRFGWFNRVMPVPGAALKQRKGGHSNYSGHSDKHRKWLSNKSCFLR